MSCNHFELFQRPCFVPVARSARSAVQLVQHSALRRYNNPSTISEDHGGFIRCLHQQQLVRALLRE
ncbi:MAG: hypothetical protein ACPIOQ_28180, partial [Promethearchaeia archaeon]